MPKHLTKLDTYAEPLPDVTTFPDGFPIVNETDGRVYLARPNRVPAAWVAASPGSLSELEDVTISSTPATGDFLRFDGVDWKPRNPPINDLADVDTASALPANGDVLTFDGTAWKPAAGGGGGGGGGGAAALPVDNSVIAARQRAVFKDMLVLANGDTLAIEGHYLYAGYNATDRFSVLSIEDPLAPTPLATLVDSVNLDGIRGLAVRGHFAYIGASIGDRLTIVDISNPTAPVVSGSLQDATNFNGIWGIAVHDNYAYVCGELTKTVVVVDVSDPTAPVVRGNFNTGYPYLRDLVYRDGYIFATAPNGIGLFVIDVTNPDLPVQVGTMLALDGAHDMVIEGNYAYITGGISNTVNLTVVDISNPAAPTIVGTLLGSAAMSECFGIALKGRYAYLTAHVGDAFVVVDISNPAAPKEVTAVVSADLDGARKIAIKDNYAYVVSTFGDNLVVLG